MNYPDGQKVMVGDTFSLFLTNPTTGVVVCSIDDGVFTAEYPAEDWADLEGGGVMVVTEETGLTHFPNAPDSMKLIARGD